MKAVGLHPRRRAVRPRDHERPRHHRRRHPHRAARAGPDGRAPAQSLADLAGVMTRLPQVLVNVPDVDKARADEDAVLAAAVAEAEAELGDAGRVLLRPSGTEPLVRVMVEAGTRGAGARRRRPARRRRTHASSRCPDRHPGSEFRCATPRASLGSSLVDIREIDQARRGAGPPALGDRPGRRGGEPSLRLLPAVGDRLADLPGRPRRLEIVLLGAFDGDAMVGRRPRGREPCSTTCTRRTRVDLRRPRRTSAAASAGRWTRRASTWPAPAAAGC